MTLAAFRETPATGTIGLFSLREFGDRPAVLTAEGTVSYAALADRVAQRAEMLGSERRLVLIEGSNSVEPLVTYLAALSSGNPALLLPGDSPAHLEAVTAAYDPDVVFTRSAGEWLLAERRAESAHELHPDLALLLSTSGSTGSPKMVRLSGDNLRSNARSIAEFLGLTSDDRAPTTLPMHYCYGLSVVNSHLAVGAGLALTELSVVDERFWDFFASAGATSLAGVPYTFDLLDRSGFADMDLAGLRYVTQAGGRLAPQRVARYARLGRDRGWDFHVMYGQTEATARMAHLPPHLAESRPQTIGVAVPGGELGLQPVPGLATPGVGELVYRGPNVMMGYAEAPTDLAQGPTVAALRTGDLARRHPDGLFEIVGRLSRNAKVFGLRINLDEVETVLTGQLGRPVRCVARDDRLHVFVTRHCDVPPARRGGSELCGLPLGAVFAAYVNQLPTTSAGKPDHAALERHAAALAPQARPTRPSAGADSVTAIRDLYAAALGRPDATVDDSFVTLGGDSLSFVELSVALGDVLGRVPSDWHTRSVRELAGHSPAGRRWGALLEPTVLLRSLAILLVVGTHANLFTVYGGAHILLAVAGYNFARFQLGDVPRVARLRSGLAALTQVALPSALWIGLVGLFVGTYEPATVVFLNGLLGSDDWTIQWQFWFLEAWIWTMAAALAVIAIPRIDAAERKAPFLLAAGVLAAGLVLRYGLVGVEAGPTERYTPAIVFWCFALGWAAAKATRPCQRWLVSAVGVATIPGFFGDLEREAVVLLGLLALLWLREIRAPRVLAMAAGVIASSSLAIYLTHWQVYPHLEMTHPPLAVICSVAAGVAYWAATRRAMRVVTSHVRRGRR
jgi:non-ribosomal peptide synthetase component E (peptide arylation enzyme)/acyl carrier protein